MAKLETKQFCCCLSHSQRYCCKVEPFIKVFNIFIKTFQNRFCVSCASFTWRVVGEGIHQIFEFVILWGRRNLNFSIGCSTRNL